MTGDTPAGRLFSTPVVVERLADAWRVNPVLERLIEERRSLDPGIARSNLGGWHSDNDFLQWAGRPLAPVVQRIVELADAATLDLQAQAGRRRGWLVDGWANVNPPGGAANAAHSHGGSYWSAVYYVRIDEGEGGALVLYDPRMPAIDMHAPALRFRDMGGEQQVKITPVAGMIVIFPSWLLHAVQPWSGDGKRISIAINLAAGPIPAA